MSTDTVMEARPRSAAGGIQYLVLCRKKNEGGDRGAPGRAWAGAGGLSWMCLMHVSKSEDVEALGADSPS